MISVNRFWARSWFSNWPRYSMWYLEVSNFTDCPGDEIAVSQIDAYGQIPPVVLARDYGFPVVLGDVGDLRQRNPSSARAGEREIAESIKIAPRAQGKAYRQVVNAVTDIDLRDRGASHPILNEIRDVGNVDSVARGRDTIGFYRDLGQRRLLEDGCLRGATNVAQDIDDLARDPAILVEIITEHLDDQQAVRPADQVVDHVADRLIDADVDPGKLEQARIELAEKVGLGFSLGPSVVRRKADGRLDVRGRPGVDRGIFTAELSDDVGHLRKLPDGPAQLVRHFACSFE
jgi:hypothetical protein